MVHGEYEQGEEKEDFKIYTQLVKNNAVANAEDNDDVEDDADAADSVVDENIIYYNVRIK